MTPADPQQLRRRAESVLYALRGAGHETYFAGGSVRDLQLEREPTDYDLATSARPEQVQGLFDRTVAVGAAFGVIVVLVGDTQIEVTTFRTEGGYADGRHPESVTFASAQEDVSRRDFTINGLLYDPQEDRLLDYVGGQADLEAGLIRCIGDPRRRFTEDRLRLLRALRFAVRFDFEIEAATWEALVALAPGIDVISAERVRDELLKMLTGPRPAEALKLLDRSGLLALVLPEVAALRGVTQPPDVHPEGDVFVHTGLLLAALKAPEEAEPWETEALWLAALLHDVGKPATRSEDQRIRFHRHEGVGAELAEEISRRLRLSNDQVQRVKALVRDHMLPPVAPEMRRSRLLRLLREPHIEGLLALFRADRLAGSGALEAYDFCRAELATLAPEVLHPERLLTGHDLMALGVPRGPQLGRIVRALEDAQLEGEVTDRAGAEQWLRRRLQADDLAAGEADDET